MTSKRMFMPCMDCQKETVGDDYYMVKNKIWFELTDVKERLGYLCLKCLKKRMNHIGLRYLKKSDFKQNKELWKKY